MLSNCMIWFSVCYVNSLCLAPCFKTFHLYFFQMARFVIFLLVYICLYGYIYDYIRSTCAFCLIFLLVFLTPHHLCFQADSAKTYFNAIEATLNAALCVRNFPSQVVERHNKPEIEARYVFFFSLFKLLLVYFDFIVLLFQSSCWQPLISHYVSISQFLFCTTLLPPTNSVPYPIL